MELQTILDSLELQTILELLTLMWLGTMKLLKYLLKQWIVINFEMPVSLKS